MDEESGKRAAEALAAGCAARGAGSPKYRGSYRGHYIPRVPFAGGGCLGAEALAFRVRVLSRELSSLTPDAVLRGVTNFRAAERTLFADYLRDLRILVGNVQCFGAEMAPDQAQVQLAIKTVIQDQFLGISRHVLAAAMIARRRLNPPRIADGQARRLPNQHHASARTAADAGFGDGVDAGATPTGKQASVFR